MIPMRVFPAVLLALTFAVTPVAIFAADDAYGTEVYTKNCAQCHDQATEARVPPRASLERMTSAAVNRGRWA